MPVTQPPPHAHAVDAAASDDDPPPLLVHSSEDEDDMPQPPRQPAQQPSATGGLENLEIFAGPETLATNAGGTETVPVSIHGDAAIAAAPWQHFRLNTYGDWASLSSPLAFSIENPLRSLFRVDMMHTMHLGMPSSTWAWINRSTSGQQAGSQANPHMVPVPPAHDPASESDSSEASTAYMYHSEASTMYQSAEESVVSESSNFI